ncbi:T9SS type A sorting domain-containing protein [uncultured Hymenobacter sp.]|uniref:T9SS type A sorting domain-containing protein n=1 Tax=uncultured Hymenobacter sp. TaxID=170016 RepID=UPI0035CC4C4A
MGLLAASLTGPAQALAQTPCPPAGIRTDPANPADPSGKINTFNWYYGNYQPSVYNGRLYTLNSPYPGVGQEYIDLPWLQPSNAVMDRFQGHIDTPGDGWELIRRDLGYFDSGAPAKTTNPLLIIYNRRTSVLRVFTAVGDPQNNFQFAEIKLKFGAAIYKAATLNRMSALGVALEDTEPRTNPEFVAATRYLNSRSRWFVADFPMDYDPCICQFDSKLAIEVNLITQADVRLTGKTTGTLISMKDGGASTAVGSTGSDMDKGLPFIRKVNSALDAGGKSYDNIDKFTTKMSDLFPGKAASLKSLSDASKAGSFLKTGLNSLPYLGTALSMLDFFMGGGQDAGPQSVVMEPMTIEMSTTTTGTITTNNWYTSSTFQNPGNRQPNSVPEKIPFYNEAMGVFSLLNKPVIEYRTVTTNRYSDRSSTITRSFRLANDLQYVINPASGLEVQDFKVAIVLTGQNDIAPIVELSPGIPASGDFETQEGPVVGGGLGRYAYRSNYADAACIKNSVFESNEFVKDSNPYFRFQQAFLKVMLNLKVINGTPTQQNVLFVARYPITLTTVSSFPALPAAQCGVLPQASASAIRAVCDGTKYRQAIALARPGRPTPTAGTRQSDKLLQAYPNPAAGLVRLSYQVTQPGHVRLTLSDALGRKVRTIVDQPQAAAGTFEATAALTGLRAGVYFCTLHTASQHVVEKIVVTD